MTVSGHKILVCPPIIKSIPVLVVIVLVSSLNVVGPKVKEARLANQPPITQEQLATRLQVLGWDIDRFGVSKIERGQRQVIDKEILLLAEALGVTVEQILKK